MRTCTKPGCENPHIARGFCTKHYQAARKGGLPTVLVRGRKCSEPDCGKPHAAKGYCWAHYLRVYKHGHTGKLTMLGEPLLDRIMAKVRKTESGCWLFTGTLSGFGYGDVRSGARMVKAHRATYELLRGPIPKGLELDHLCRTPACVNPDHLEPVTRQENARRSRAGHDWASRKRNSSGQFMGRG